MPARPGAAEVPTVLKKSGGASRAGRVNSGDPDEGPGGLLVGVDRADITPELPIALAGYAHRREPAEQVLAPLRLRTAVLDQPGAEPVALVSADLLWWGDDLVERVRPRVAEATGLAADRLVLHATHNHSGPQTAHGMTPSLGLPDERYLDRLVDALIASVRRARATPVPVRVVAGQAGGIAVVDRRSARTAGRLTPGTIDDTLTVIGFLDEDDTVVCAGVHLACHPVVHHGNAVTPDLLGTLASQLEDDLAPVVLPLQGCCGDVNPARYRPDGTFVDGGQAEVERDAGDLAALARTALAGATDAGAPALAITRRQVTLPLLGRAPEWLLPELIEVPGHVGEWAALRGTPGDPTGTRPDPVLQLVRLDLTDGLALLGMSGEPVSRYGLRVRDSGGGRVLPLGYTDGMSCYLVTADQIAEGGYEPCEAPLWFGLPAPLSPGVEELLLGELDALADRARTPAR